MSLRRLENQALAFLYKEQIVIETGDVIKVSIGQFNGIEINDFAVTVAKTALWIAESQMMRETEQIVLQSLDFLPLKTDATIIEGNALRLDWADVVPPEKLNYIMGNPPFVGSSRLSEEQKADRQNLFENGGELDYVCCWYKKAAVFVKDYPVRCAFVSTNSICQGQQVAPLWSELYKHDIVINLAHRTFVWDSETNDTASVYCVIIGFSKIRAQKAVLYSDNVGQEVDNINGYLIAAPNILVSKRSVPFCDVPAVIKGFQPTDNGLLILSDEEKNSFIKSDPKTEKWIRPFITAKEYLHGKTRWCLWLVGISPAELKSMPLIRARVEKCKEWRSSQTKTGDAYKLKDIPHLLRPSAKFKDGDFIVFPLHSSENRNYIPFGFAKTGSIPGNSVSILPNATLYHLGILSSSVHNAWTRVVCGRIKSDYRYSSDIVYNNFVWCNPTDEQRAKIEQTALAILDARAKYPDSSLADLYDETLMPPELRKAHKANDEAVLAAYGLPKNLTESDIMVFLFKKYAELTGGKQ